MLHDSPFLEVFHLHVGNQRQSHSTRLREGKSSSTQLLAHSLSNCTPCFPHLSRASLSSLTLSMMALASRQAKKASRASQQCERWLRFGASGVPSADTFGGGGVEGVEDENSPIFEAVPTGRA